MLVYPPLLLLLLLAQACDGDPASPRDPAEQALATSATAPAFTQEAGAVVRREEQFHTGGPH